MESERSATASWHDSPLGARVLRDEAAVMRCALEDVFGFELLQVGAWGNDRLLLAAARTQHTTLLAACRGAGATLCAELASLPLPSDSIDAILLPHTLELVQDPYAVLREAARVLCAEGCLMICGFNPWSGWGLRRQFGRTLRRAPFPPGTQRLLSERRLRDWVALLGFDVDRIYGYLGMLPLAGAAGLTWDGADAPGSALTSGAYLLKARKRVPTLTLVRPRRRVRQRVLVGVPEATSTVGHGRR